MLYQPENFEKYVGVPLSSIVPKLEADGIDLLDVKIWYSCFLN